MQDTTKNEDRQAHSAHDLAQENQSIIKPWSSINLSEITTHLKSPLLGTIKVQAAKSENPVKWESRARRKSSVETLHGQPRTG